jgi:restriction system-associated AAA family ATPase
MKLLRLKLNSAFRSLQPGFEVHFLRGFDLDKNWEFMPYCLVGSNGSGKSNVLEALAAIFYHIECIYLNYKPDSFEGEGDFNQVHTEGFFAESSYPDAFELEYLYHIQGDFDSTFDASFDTGYEAHIRIEKKSKQRPIISWLNREEIENNDQLELSRLDVKQFLPEYVVAYSSGENQILHLPFFKMRFIQFDEYLDKLTKDLPYAKPESRLVYLDSYFNQAILLAIYLLREKETLTPFLNEIGIEGIISFRLIIRQHHEVPIHDDVFRTMSSEDRENPEKLKRELTSKIKDSIDKLVKCSTCNYFDDETQEWYLDYFVDNEVKKAFKLHFGDAFELFNTLQILLNLNYYQVKPELKQRIYQSNNIYLSQDIVPFPYEEDRVIRFKDLVLKKNGSDAVLYTRSLSDGEYQLIHSIGLCLLFRDTNSLFLLDEPETHFNPSWRAKFISTLKDCLNQEGTGKNNRRELLITSHSPFIVSDCHQENVLVFTKDDETGMVTVKRPNFNTFGASVNQITIKVFGKRETIGSYANAEYDKLYKRLAEGEEPETLITEANQVLGDSVEKILFVNKATEK